jgi:hypothetical protein
MRRIAARGMRAFFGVVFAATSAASCSLVLPFRDLHSDNASNDVIVEDAGANAEANLLPNPGFEEGDCAGWVSNGGTFSRDGLARSGAASCRVCAGGEAIVGLSPGALPIVPSTGERYQLSAYIRAAPDSGASMGWQAVLQTSVDSLYGVGVDPNDTWAEMVDDLDITTSDAGRLSAYFNTNVRGDGGWCVLIDDAVLVRVR